MKDSREILCGLTYHDVIGCAGMSQRAAAKRLGVGERHFHSVLHKSGMAHWFPNVRSRKRCVTREQIVELAQEGYIRADVAHMLDISPSYLKDLINLFDISHLFTVTKGHAAWVNRRGYCQ